MVSWAKLAAFTLLYTHEKDVTAEYNEIMDISNFKRPGTRLCKAQDRHYQSKQPATVNTKLYTTSVKYAPVIAIILTPLTYCSNLYRVLLVGSFLPGTAGILPIHFDLGQLIIARQKAANTELLFFLISTRMISPCVLGHQNVPYLRFG